MEWLVIAFVLWIVSVCIQFFSSDKIESNDLSFDPTKDLYKVDYLHQIDDEPYHKPVKSFVQHKIGTERTEPFVFVPDPNPIRYANQFMSREDKIAYMRTDGWRQLKQQRLTIANYTCECIECDNKSNLHLHHTDYIRLGNEHISDLRIVCSKHHTQIHDKLGYDRTTEYPIEALG